MSMLDGLMTGINAILESGVAKTFRQTLDFGDGFSVTDDGTKLLVEQDLADVTGIGETYHKVYTGEVSVTDDKVTTLLTIPMIDGCGAIIDLRVKGFDAADSDGNQARYWWVVDASYRSSLGAHAWATDDNAVVADAVDDVLWALSLATSGANLLVQIKGDSKDATNWSGRAIVDYVVATPQGPA